MTARCFKKNSAIHNSSHYKKDKCHDVETNVMSDNTLCFQLVYLTTFMEPSWP